MYDRVQCGEAGDLVRGLREKVAASSDVSQERGLSLLELKHQLMLRSDPTLQHPLASDSCCVNLLHSYVINLVELMLIKVEGQSLVNHPVVGRLTEIRTVRSCHPSLLNAMHHNIRRADVLSFCLRVYIQVMEKIRPIDHKLRYQVDKLIRMATNGVSGELCVQCMPMISVMFTNISPHPPVPAGDPLYFRPRPSQLISKLKDNEGAASSDSDVTDGEEEEGRGKGQLYVPPRVVAVPYDDHKEEGRRSKHKKSRGSVLQELKDELSDAPIELKV